MCVYLLLVLAPERLEYMTSDSSLWSYIGQNKHCYSIPAVVTFTVCVAIATTVSLAPPQNTDVPTEQPAVKLQL